MFNRPLLFSEVEKVVKTYLLNPQLNKPLLIIGAPGIGKTAAINNALKELEMNDFPQIAVGSSIRVPNKRWGNISEFINEKLELFKDRDNRDIADESGNHFIIESGLAVLRFENDSNATSPSTPKQDAQQMASIVTFYNDEEWTLLSKMMDTSSLYVVVMGAFEANSDAFVDEWLSWGNGGNAKNTNTDDGFNKEIEEWFGNNR